MIMSPWFLQINQLHWRFDGWWNVLVFLSSVVPSRRGTLLEFSCQFCGSHHHGLLCPTVLSHPFIVLSDFACVWSGFLLSYLLNIQAHVKWRARGKASMPGLILLVSDFRQVVISLSLSFFIWNAEHNTYLTGLLGLKKMVLNPVPGTE